MQGILLPMCSVFFSILLLIVYFAKKRINLHENNVFSAMLVFSLLDSLLVSILQSFPYFGITSEKNLWIPILNKIDIGLLIMYCYCIFVYTILITVKRKNLSKKMIVFGSGFAVVSFLISLFGNVVVISKNNNFSISGTTTFVAVIACGLFLFAAFVVTIINIKSITKRHIPIFSVVGLIFILILLFKINPYLIIISIALTFVNYIMFFTIENPDMKMIEQLEKAKNEADRANRAKTDFLSSMSHEIRTPLNAIVGFSDCIVNSNSLTDAKENAKDIVNASKTLLEIVNGILGISKIESGKMELVCISYDSRAAFREVANLLIPKMEEKGLKFSSYIAPDVPTVLYGDVNNVKKIISNLLSNAVKYTDKGFIRYEVSCVNDGDISRLVISVEDSGRGIKQDAVKNLFSKFQRLDEDRNTTIEGTGLGLAITKQLIDLMGGQIAVHTVYGSGSKFTVMIPQKISTEVIKIESEIEKPKVIQKDIDLAAAKILIVDDNNLNLKVASKLLEKQGANNITCVNSGFDCLDRISMGEKYDLIFMDDMMPKMSGKETFLKLKAIPGFITPVVALTANAISGSKEEYLKVGFSDYLAKPIEKSELTRVLGSVLKEKEEVVSTVTVVDNKELDEKAETKEEYLRRNGVNVDKALELLGDMNMYEVTLKDFLNSIDKKWENIKKYKEEGDLANYSIEVHSLKSDCKYLGFTKLANISFLHELKSKDGDKGYIDRHFSDLENAYNVAIKIMKGV